MGIIDRQNCVSDGHNIIIVRVVTVDGVHIARYNTGNTIVLRGIRLCEINIIMINNRETMTNIPVPGTV
jgi:hypothetical protein